MAITIHKAVHKIINRNGASLWLPSNIIGGRMRFGEPDIYAESSTQIFPIGTKLEYADGRVFRYGKWGATSTNVPLARMVVNANAEGAVTGYVADDGFEGNLYAAASAGQEYVDLWTIIAASGTGIRTTVYAENFFEDGMLAVYGTLGYREYRICGSEITTTPYTRVYLDAPLKEALTVGTTAAYVTDGTLTAATGGSGVTAYASIYSQLKDAAAEGSTYVSAVGAVLTNTFTSGYFGWVQTWGRCIITPTAYFGDSANERMAQLHTDGCIALADSYSKHIVGYLTSRTVSGYGDLEIMLQLGR
jgi:hypothetical protein